MEIDWNGLVEYGQPFIDLNMLTPDETTSAVSHRPRDGSLTQSPPETGLGGEGPNARVTGDAAVRDDVSTRRALQMMTSLTVEPTTDPQTLHFKIQLFFAIIFKFRPMNYRYG